MRQTYNVVFTSWHTDDEKGIVHYTTESKVESDDYLKAVEDLVSHTRAGGGDVSLSEIFNVFGQDGSYHRVVWDEEREEYESLLVRRGVSRSPTSNQYPLRIGKKPIVRRKVVNPHRVRVDHDPAQFGNRLSEVRYRRSRKDIRP